MYQWVYIRHVKYHVKVYLHVFVFPLVPTTLFALIASLKRTQGELILGAMLNVKCCKIATQLESIMIFVYGIYEITTPFIKK